jgi:hypothetical protein
MHMHYSLIGYPINTLNSKTYILKLTMSQPHFWKSVKMTLTLPKMGILESSETPETSELDFRGQNTSL